MPSSLKLDELLGQALCSRAADLARRRHYDAALELLRSVPTDHGPSRVAVLDLQARIAAQRGQFAAAEQLWNEAQQLDPGHEGARRGLERIAQINRRHTRSVSGALSVSLILIAVAVIVWMLAKSTLSLMDAIHGEMLSAKTTIRPAGELPWTREMRANMAGLAAGQKEQARQIQQLGMTVGSSISTNQQENTQRLRTLETALAGQAESQKVTNRQLQQLNATVSHNIASNQQENSRRFQAVETAVAKQTKNQQTTLRQLQVVRKDLARLAPPPPPVLIPPALPPPVAPPVATPPSVNLNLSGVVTRATNGVLVVTFAEGLFTGGTILSEKAAKTLQAVALALKPQAAELNITVIGCAAAGEILPGRAVRDDVAMSLRRATVVAEFLREYAHCPPACLTVQGIGCLNDSTPNERAGGMHQRTVILRISH